MTSKLLLPLVTLLLLSSASVAMTIGSSDSNASDQFTITDGTGKTFQYSGLTEHIITMGYASTLTVVELGMMEKIIGIDKYSTYESSGNDKLKDIDKYATNLGSLYYSSNNDYIVSTLVQWVESEKMSLDDTIILTAYSNALVLRDSLNEKGFTHVLVYLSIVDYENIVDFVRSMSLITTGKESGLVSDMKATLDTIVTGLKDVTEKSKGLYVRYYSSNFTVGNTGSIAVSLITSAGGINLGYNESISSSAYGDASTVVGILKDNKDAIVFLDGTYLKTHAVSDFRNEVLGGDTGITIVPMESIWNNYCPDAMYGLWTFACALYPDIFSGDVPSGDDDSNGGNALMYAGVAIAVIIVIGIIGFAVMKR